MPTTDIKFPKTIEAATVLRELHGRQLKAQWNLADALLEELGPPGEDGVRTGVYAQIEDVRKELKANGFPYSFDHLRDLRRVAHDIAPVDRTPGVSLTAHLEAGDAATLKQIVEAAEKSKPKKSVTKSFVKNWIADRDAKEKEKGPTESEHVIALRDAMAAVVEAKERAKVFARNASKVIDPTALADLIDKCDAMIEAWTPAIEELRDRLSDLDEPHDVAQRDRIDPGQGHEAAL